ncbi:MAG: FHA domain-containing protein [Gemmataceae bacterium]|nr:FHA domain-containing protein [Gemmataceae bacterium]
MLGVAWLTLRQAQEALKNGRLEDAHRLLSESGAQGHKRSWDLLQQIAQGFVERAQRHLSQNDADAAWNDLLRAEQVGAGDNKAAAQLRQTLANLALAQARAQLEAGHPVRAAEAVVLLRERGVRHSELDPLEEIAREWKKAQELADRGEFPAAMMLVKRLWDCGPRFRTLEQFQTELDERRDRFAGVLVKLHQAVADGHWRQVVGMADEVLAAAPQHAEARKARTRAWQVTDPSTVGAPPQTTEKPVSAPGEPANRVLLWIDGIGGYLVCLGHRVTIGQALPEATVDVPLFADVSRLHATVTRDAEGYLLEAARTVAVNSKPVERALLQSGDRITMGASCQLQFRQPVPVSTTARLDLASGHRLAQAVDAVILMADTLVIGPGAQSHVTIPDLRQPIVLFRQKGGLGIRHAGPFTVDGQRCQERGQLGPTSRVVGEEFTFAVEPASR